MKQSEFKKVTISDEYVEKYWTGRENIFIRQFSYLRSGFGLVNEAKNYFLIIFGTYWTARVIVIWGYTINPNWILLIGIVGVPFLVWIGRWELFKAGRAREYIIKQHGSVTQYQDHNMLVDQTEFQKQILEELKKLNKK